MLNNDHKESNSVIDTVEVVGGELLGRVKAVIRAGNARRLVIRKPSGDALIEIPLTVGLAAGITMLYLAPVLTAVATIGVLFTKVRLDIVRTSDGGEGF